MTLGQQCAMGFLNEESLKMIMDASRDTYDYGSISFTGFSMPMSVNQFGPLKKIIIAARFNINMPVGWPEMQIMQRASNGHMPMVAFTTNATEPKPTGYLNLYEYNLEETMLHIKPGDTLDIHDSYQSSRFSLAYYSNGTFSIPLVSFVMGDCESETEPLTLNILNCEDAIPWHQQVIKLALKQLLHIPGAKLTVQQPQKK